jgi:heat shock protein HtpX
MDKVLGANHKLRNRLQTLFLVVGMSVILAGISRLILGPELWLVSFITLLLVVLMLPNISPYWVLKLYQARPIDPRQSPPLFQLISDLSERAGLQHEPRIYWIPSQTLNAFAVGSPNKSAIAVSEGLLEILDPHELAGVLAHEISHIRNNDLRLLMLADIFTRLTHILSLIGILTILISLPWYLMGSINISIIGLLLLIFTPALSALLQLALSRVREFDADLDAARITNNPAALAKALLKINQRNLNPWQRILFPGYREYLPSILRTHPDTNERVRRLLSLEAATHHEQRLSPHFHKASHPYAHVFPSAPRQHFFIGIWR